MDVCIQWILWPQCVQVNQESQEHQGIHGGQWDQEVLIHHVVPPVQDSLVPHPFHVDHLVHLGPLGLQQVRAGLLVDHHDLLALQNLALQVHPLDLWDLEVLASLMDRCVQGSQGNLELL